VTALRDINASRNESTLERSFEPIRAHDLPPEAFVGAAKAIPEDATYHVVVGNTLPLTSGKRAALVPLLRYWLLPRRIAPDISEADWIIAWGQPTELLSLPVGRGVEVSPAVVVAEVVR
jgi:hypothetical protein